MPAIWTSRQPWVRRPSGIVAPNRGSGQASGLVAWWPVTQHDGAGIRDVISGNVAAPSAAVLAVSPEGRGLGGAQAYWTDTTASRYCSAVVTPAVIDVLTTYNATVSVWATAAAFAANSSVVCFDGTDDWIFAPYDDANGNGPRVFWRDVGGNQINLNGGVPAADGQWHVFTYVTRASNSHALYVDGALVGTSTATGAAGPFTGVDLLGWRGGNQPFRGAACDWRIYRRALSDAEIRALYDPRTRWELYQPIVKRSYFDMAGGAPPANVEGTGALTAGSATLSATGTLRVTATASVTATAATLSATGAQRHTATSALTAQAATTAATATQTHRATSTLTAGAATVTASGSVGSAITGTSTLTATAATLAATAGQTHRATSALTATGATITASGIVGSAIVGTSVLTAPTATLAGTGAQAHRGTAALTAATATLSATGTVASGAVTGTATLSATAATLAAVATQTHYATATLTASAATIWASQSAVLAADADTWRARPRPTAWRAKARPTDWTAKP